LSHWRLDPLFPAVPVFLDERDQVAGLQVATDDFRLVYLPFDLDGVEAELYQPLIESGLRFLQQDVQVQLEVPGHAVGDFTLVLPVESPTLVRARITGAAGGTDLVVRSLPRLDLLAELPMERVEEAGETQMFEVAFQPPAFGLVQVSLGLHGPDGEDLFHSSSQRVLGFSPDKPILAFLGDQYDRFQKEDLRTTLGESFGQMGLEASFVDLVDEDAEFFEGLLSQYLEEGRLVVWLGGRIDVETESVFREFMEGAGRMLVVSRLLGNLRNSKAFRQDILHSARIVATATLMVRSLSPGEPVEFEVSHSPTRWPGRGSGNALWPRDGRDLSLRRGCVHSDNYTACSDSRCN
jgi:hypothetical protein